MLKSTAITILGATFALTAAVGCSDTWDEHYSPDTGNVIDATIYGFVKNDAGYEKFCRMIEVSGYADLLNTTQTFTVWIPSAESLSEISLDNTDEVRRIVANHIARFNVSSATPKTKGVKMYNGKMLFFDGGTFGGIALGHTDIRLKNGIAHELNGMIPYSYNIREYIDTHDETSKLSEFIRRFDEEKFDEAASTPIDIDENGATIYDSVKVLYNRLFQHPIYGLGNIQAEDSLFTMLIPDNKAWDESYARIAPLFNVYNADAAAADSIRDTQTSLAVVHDLIFRSLISDAADDVPCTTTSGNTINSMGSFFGNAEKIAASNGLAYLTSSIDWPEHETFNQPILVEAENTAGRVRGANTTIYTRVASTDNIYTPEISDGSYIEVTATSVSRQPAVTFDIPNTLSGEYDIYARFVPASIDDYSMTTDSTRVRFILTYMQENGRSTEKVFSDDSYLTSGDKVTTIKVTENFKFPVSNFYDNLWLMEEENDEAAKTVTTKLYITTNVSSAEFNNNELTRRFRLDCIYMIPSQK